MTNTCPICDIEFEDTEPFLQHIEDHKNKSILNKPPEPISKINDVPKPMILDTRNFFGKKHFEELISHKIKNITDVDEIIPRRNFVEQVKKIVSKNPFVYLPHFVDDLLDGQNSTDLIHKYNITNSIKLSEIVKDVLLFDRSRYRKNQYENAFVMNLKIPTWQDKHDILKDNFSFFRNELLEITFLNILRSFILLIMTDFIDDGISKEDIIKKARSLQTNYDIFKFVDYSLKKSFEVFFETGFENMVKKILEELALAKILRKKTPESDLLIGKLSIDNLKSDILKELRYSDGSQPEFYVRTTIENKYPSLRLMPGIGLWHTALSELENEKMIHPLENHKRSKILFLNEDYKRIQQNLDASTKTIKFYGRHISPDEFIEELLELDRGDFDDEDDQVTRIAGLILAESVKLQPPHENLSEFDFATDITNYKFRPEQITAIAKLDFQINSNIFHCKVMLDEELTPSKYDSLRNAIPENEQGIIFTFKKILKDVAELLKNNKTIQVIDEEGLKIWTSITPQIPARKNSIAKIHHDPVSKKENKIVKINVIDYETNLTSVSILPTMQEITVFTGSLEEISISKYNPREFESHSKTYLDFLHKLAELSPDTFHEGMFEEIIDVYSNRADLMVDLNPELYKDGYKYNDNETYDKNNTKYIRFENVHSTINIKYLSNMTCTCQHKLNEEHHHTLCKHLVAAINHLYKEELNEGGKSKRQVLEEHLLEFQESNIKRMIQTINDIMSDKDQEIFRNYLKAHV